MPVFSADDLGPGETYKVFIDGEDVSMRCIRCDIENGWAELLSGWPYFEVDEDGEPIIKRTFGAVAIQKISKS